MKKYCLGGSIAVGKTSIINKIKNSMEYEDLYKNILIAKEFDLDSMLLKDLMGSTYGKNIIPHELMQLYTQFDRWLAYIKNSILLNEGKYNMALFDRGPLDPIVFAIMTIEDKEQIDLLIKYSINLLKKVFKQYGKPDLYFILKVDNMDTIKNRLVVRGRESEVKNINNDFINKLNTNFHTHLIDLCKKLGVRYKLINASKKLNDVYSDIVNTIKKEEKNEKEN